MWASILLYRLHLTVNILDFLGLQTYPFPLRLTKLLKTTIMFENIIKVLLLGRSLQWNLDLTKSLGTG